MLKISQCENNTNDIIDKFKNIVKEFATNEVSIKSQLQGNIEALENQIRELINNYQHLQIAIDHSIIIATTDLQGRITFVNDKFCEISKFSREELIGKNHRILNSGYHEPGFFDEMWRTIVNGEIWSAEVKNKAKDGSYYWVKSTVIPFNDVDGKPFMFFSIRTDITEGKLLESKLRKAVQNDFKRTVRSLHNLVFKLKKEESGRYIYTMTEGKLAEELGIQSEVTYRKSPDELFPPELVEKVEIYYKQAFLGEPQTYEFEYEARDFITILSPIIEHGKVVEVIGSSSEITTLKKSEQIARFLAFHDSLTGLPNKESLLKDFAEWITNHKQFVMMMVDLNRFKEINDGLGHAVGDKLLTEVANKLKKELNDDVSIYRWGGDEFIILAPYDCEDDVTSYVEILFTMFEQKFKVDHHEFYITISLGACIYSDINHTVETCIKHSEIAMYEAKQSQTGNRYLLFSESIQKNIENKFYLGTELRKALEVNDQIVVYYQPKVSGVNQKIEGMEALVRWIHPEKGMISPVDFIPLAEDTGLIHRLGEYVLRQACIDNKKLYDNQIELKVAVNVSSLEFQLPDFVRDVETVLQETELPAYLLEIELTESQLMVELERSISKIKELQKLGVTVALDDFGTGYSSLSYLKRLNINKLKIDQSFIRHLETDIQDRQITTSIIHMAKALNLEVVAEGVETENILNYLLEKGIDEIQGYYISRPINFEDFTGFIYNACKKVKN
ncbi:sensor domain-containing protein [Bacillus sp. FJAT-45350]|uniref:sensor domain-containing protein n=1 Tax=Bacillus sp. FJAT-45350 TaxID=2011014 RepID=UPI000BB8C720|nr:bifunctional diguanylate cyclase/phosphodiesterase [Bacillus sp. FJAT-45350]